MTINVAINGFGRIGRCTLSAIVEQAREDLQVVKMNATGPFSGIAHLLKYDSVHGRFGGEIIIDGDQMDVGQGPIQVFSTYDPETLDGDGVDVVLECSGQFNSRDAAAVRVLAWYDNEWGFSTRMADNAVHMGTIDGRNSL